MKCAAYLKLKRLSEIVKESGVTSIYDVQVASRFLLVRNIILYLSNLGIRWSVATFTVAARAGNSGNIVSSYTTLIQRTRK